MKLPAVARRRGHAFGLSTLGDRARLVVPSAPARAGQGALPTLAAVRAARCKLVRVYLQQRYWASATIHWEVISAHWFPHLNVPVVDSWQLLFMLRVSGCLAHAVRDPSSWMDPADACGSLHTGTRLAHWQVLRTEGISRLLRLYKGLHRLPSLSSLQQKSLYQPRLTPDDKLNLR